MRFSFRKPGFVIAFLICALVAGTAAAAAFEDWGLSVQTQMENKSEPLFGVGQPLTKSSNVDLNQAQALADPAGLLTVAKGLHVNVVTAGKAAPNLDQMVLWPQSDPQYIIACNEQGTANPGLQKINLGDGAATTIATGITSCDPVRATPWGTVLFGEEGGSTGAMYELIDPLSVEGATINRTTGATSTPKIRRVNALGFLSFEGLAILPNGVTYYGDELSAGNGAPGGSFYKFVPTTPWPGGPPSPTSISHRTPVAPCTGFGSARVRTSGRASSSASAPGSCSRRHRVSSCAHWRRPPN
jgi:hypothetical protein